MIVLSCLLLLVLLGWCVCQVEFHIMCRRNCDTGSQIDAHKEIEVMTECISGCDDRFTFLWDLESPPKNIKQKFERDDTLGFNTSYFTILPNVLRCGEVYDLTVTIKYTGGTRVYVVEIAMKKCSRKYPPGEEADETQMEYEYTDFEYIERPEEYKEWSNPKLWKQYHEGLNLLLTMYNRTKNNAMPKKKIELLNILEHVTSNLYAAINETRFLMAGRNHYGSVVKRALEVAHILFTRQAPKESNFDTFRSYASRLLYATLPEFNKEKTDLGDHRAIPTQLPGKDFDPQERITDYPDYNDFDLIYRKRIEIIEDIRATQFQIFKTIAMVRTKMRDDRNFPQYRSFIVDIKTESNDEYESIPHCLQVNAAVAVCFPNPVKDGIFKVAGFSGIVLMYLKDNILWTRSPGKDAINYYLSVGTADDPYKFGRTNNPFYWKVQINHKHISRVYGYFRMPAHRTYNQINDDCLGIHEIYLDYPTSTTCVIVEGVDRYDTLQLVVTEERHPTIEDFFQHNPNTSLIYKNDHNTRITIIFKGMPAASKMYLALLPSKGTIDKMSPREDYLYYRYKLAISRINCDYVDERNYKVFHDKCNMTSGSPNNVFLCYCRKLGLYQFTNFQLKSHFLDAKFREHKIYPLNYIPAIALGVLFFLYLFALFCKAVHKGSHLVVKRVQYLMDNNLLHEIGYTLVVTTRSSTTANVAFQLHGSEASTPPHLFRGQSEPVLQATVDDWFYLLSEKDLGNLQSIDIWSNCDGFKPSWFCSRVKVINQQSNQEWIFHVNDWLTPIGRKTFKTTSIETPEGSYYFDRHIYALKGLANHLWIKTFSKLQSPVFTFCERMTVILSVFTTNMMLTMQLLNYPRVFQPFWYFQYTGYDFGSFEMMAGGASGFATFILTTFFIYCFSNSARCGGSTEALDNVRHSTVCRLCSWFLMVVFLFGSCGLVAGFGLFTSFTTCIVWLYTTLIGVVICIALESFRAMIVGCISRKIDPKIVTIDYKSIEIQRDKISRGLGKSGMRPLLQKYYSKLTDEEIKVKEKYAQEIKSLRYQKSELITYIIYILILFVIVMYNRDPLTYISANNIRDIFIEDKFIRKIELSEINSQKRFYRYLREVFLPAVHATNWYGSYGSSSPGRLVDFNSKMIGVARIRQTRIQNGTCEVPKILRNLVDECHGEYSIFSEDTGAYGEFWEPYNATKENFKSDQSWVYQGWLETKAIPFIGELAVYPAGGYTMTFGRTWSNSRIIKRYIKETKWIDQRTRAIFLDVNFYNVNDNLFNFLTIAIEQSATGAFITNYQLNTMRLFYHGEIISKVLPLLWISLSIFIFTFAWGICYQYKEFFASNCRQFLADFWNLTDFLIIFMIIGFLLTLGIRSVVIENILKSMKLEENHFISYSDIIVCQNAVEIITAILITFSTIRLWKLLRFLRQFRLFELTLRFSAKYLLSMMVINVLLILVYAVVGFLLLGPYVKEFRTVWSSFVALMLIAFGLEFNLGFDTDHQTMYSYVGYIYFAGYLILVLVLLNIFITIIVVGYNNSKEYFDHQVSKGKYTFTDFLREDWAYNRSKYKGRIRNRTIVEEANKALRELRLRAGQDPLKAKFDANTKKILSNAQSMLEMHQLADKATTLIQEKYRYSESERHEEALRVLGHYYYRFSNEDKQRTTMHDEYLVVTDADKQSVYCSMKRQNEIKTIVEYLLNRKENKTPETIENNKKLIEKQVNDVVEMRKKSEEMIVLLEKLLREGCTTRGTQVTFADLGIELSSSSSEASDEIQVDFKDGNIEITLNV